MARANDFGELLKAMRQQSNLTQAELGARLAVSQQSVAKWEAGTGVPGRKALHRVASELRVAPDALGQAWLSQKFPGTVAQTEANQLGRGLDMHSFAGRLRYLRRKAGLTLAAVGAHLGVSAQAVHKWESGGDVRSDKQSGIAKFFGVSLFWLLHGESGQEPIASSEPNHKEVSTVPRTDPQLNLRLPGDLKKQIEDAASQSGRSVTAETVHRLTVSFSRNDDGASRHGLRDHFAGQAMIRLTGADPDGIHSAGMSATLSYRLADAMLVARAAPAGTLPP